MKDVFDRRIAKLMLPGLKRWIAIIFLGILIIVYGVLLLLGVHPLMRISSLIGDWMQYTAEVLPYRISGLVVIIGGIMFVAVAVAKTASSILGAYLPEDRDSIPDVLYRKRHLERGPRVVVIGGGTGLSNLLKGLKVFTNHITAIVTVGDDGGSSGRLRDELGVLPPGDIRNCIVALADEEKLVTELFRYRFSAGQGLQGHSFGNLFLSAVCAITNGDMLEAAKVAGRVLNSCGQVLPSSLIQIALSAEMADGQVIYGESKITAANGQIKHLSSHPPEAKATPAALEAITNAELIILGPGSLYTSIIPNLLIKGITDAILQSSAQKIYVCNVVTQKGETTGYTVSNHVEALLEHANVSQDRYEHFIHAVLVNDQIPRLDPVAEDPKRMPVVYDPEPLRRLGITAVCSPLLNSSFSGHHDPEKLAKALMLWFDEHKRKSSSGKHKISSATTSNTPNKVAITSK